MASATHRDVATGRRSHRDDIFEPRDGTDSTINIRIHAAARNRDHDAAGQMRDGGSAAPSGDVNCGAKGALFLASSKGLLDPPSRSTGRGEIVRPQAMKARTA